MFFYRMISSADFGRDDAAYTHSSSISRGFGNVYYRFYIQCSKAWWNQSRLVGYFYYSGGSIMYSDSTLTNYLQESAAIETKSKVLAEYNLNLYENIATIGNYKNRPSTLNSNT